MRIERIQIKGLFDLFDYDIAFPAGEDVLIITGANGFGKTHVLELVYGVFEGKHDISILPVRELILSTNQNKLQLEWIEGTRVIFLSLFDQVNPIATRITDYNYDSAINGADSYYTDIIAPREYVADEKNLIGKFQESLTAHLIKETRLHQKRLITYTGGNTPTTQSKRTIKNLPPVLYDTQDVTFISTITEYATDLQEKIEQTIQDSLSKAQDIDSSYPKRLIAQKEKISREAYQERFEKIQKKQEKLYKNGLYHQEQTQLEYSEEDAKALLVYLDDLEEKLAVFDPLLEKLDLFTTILNERRFSYKTIHIDQNKGFTFKNSKGQELRLEQLSSGEQHEVVLLYDLIFKIPNNSLVLIDEPEISLHITWQKEFLNDLFKIIELKGFQVIVATHSPAIINDRWDLVHTLQKAEPNA